jgi:ABC-type polysaccharide/polyol phosphate export permease
MSDRKEARPATSERKPPLYTLTRARILEFVREPEALFWVFAFPIIMALVLGFAFRDRPPDPLPVGVVAGQTSPAISQTLEKSGLLRPLAYPDLETGLHGLRTGKITLLVEENQGVGTDASGAGLGLVYHYDATRPDARLARLEVDDALQRARGRQDPSPPKVALIQEKGSRYIDFLIPGILGLNLMGTGIWGVGFSIVNARLKKTLKLMVATPMRKSDFLLAQMLSRFVFLVLEVAVILAFGVWAFEVPVRGALWLLSLITVVGAVSFAGIGLLVVARARTLEAASGLMNLVMVPMWLLSGVFFSSDRFPDAAQPFIRALPLTALNDALRAVMLEGSGVLAVSGELAILTGWCVVSFAVALAIFRWQ